MTKQRIGIFARLTSVIFIMKKHYFSLFFLCTAFLSFAQRGKDGNYTVSTANAVVNSYTALNANATIGQSSITVLSNAMQGGFFASNLAPGDLILIIQMQGANLNVDTYPANEYVTSGGLYWGPFTTPVGHLNDWNQNIPLWGEILNYNNAGKYELAEVKSVASTNTINLMCPLVNNYTVAGHVQVVRVPRFVNLTINSNASAIPNVWNGTTGGVISIEVNGNLILNANGKISASASGFRGGVTEDQTQGAPPGNVNDIGFCASHVATQGAEKGESIAGFYTEYDLIYSRYCKGAPANGGGGGGNHNSGGGGGSNVGNTVQTYTGKGVPNPTYNINWNLETPGMGGSSTPGGGRGGYSGATVNQNENTVGPNVTSWGGDYRRKEGGLGGHPLLQDNTRIFAGGGGGAGDQNQSQGGNGGRGGGIAFIKVYGNISGAGIIEANGANGVNANPNGQTAVQASAQKYGHDGAGGAGGGGTIYISNGNPIPNTITLSAIGGNGGNQVFSAGLFAPAPTMEADGPGGGGGGGYISITTGTPIQILTGGASGVTNSTFVPNFPPNGATGGANGVTNSNTSFYDILAANDTLCAGGSVTLTASTLGNPPAGNLTWYTTPFGNTVAGTGNSFTTPVLNTTTTYYIGICPGSFRKPVTVVIGSNPTITGNAVITNATCAAPGSITGLSVNGGTQPYTYLWTNNGGNALNVNGAPAGSYTLTVSDAAGCSSNSGPYSIQGTAGPSINILNAVLSPALCNGTLGSISGITATGNGLTYSWTNTASNVINPTGLSAGSYTLTVTDANGCTAASTPFVIPYVSGPTIDTTNSTLTNENCGQQNGSILGVTATGIGLQYAWTPGNAITLDNQNLSTGNYSLTVTDSIGCTATAGPFALTNVPGPSLDTTQMVVTNENCGQANGSIMGIILNGGQAPVNVIWSNQQTTLDLSNLISGNYTLYATDAAGCIDSLGPIPITTTPGSNIDTSNMVITPVSCNGTLGGITGITATGNGLTYLWNNQVATANNPNVSAGAYQLTVTDVNNCTATLNVNVPQNLPVVLNENSVVLTQPTCLQNGSISGIVATGGTNNYTFQWSPGNQNTLNLSNLAPGTYSLLVIDANGCSDTSNTFTLNPPTYPIANFTFTPQDPDVNENVTFTNTSSNYTLAQWNLNGTNYFTTTWDSSFMAGVYPISLTVTNAQGCIDTLTLFLNVYDELTFPNVFTPNEDGKNDAMVIEALKPNSSITILNRWGNVVYSTQNYQNNWIGKDQQGTDLTEGVYTVLFTDPENKTQHFYVHLIR